MIQSNNDVNLKDDSIFNVKNVILQFFIHLLSDLSVKYLKIDVKFSIWSLT
jgi:hypothetical protein